MAVLELFTSQGCSSCPPADALFGTLARRGDVLALTLPVSYWDYLGWKDTLAREAFSKRQRRYAETRGDHEIYTPQVVVNGLTQVVGSREDAISRAIDATKRTMKAERVAMALSCEGEEIVVKTGGVRESSKYSEATVWIALYTRAVNVAIRRGENDGRTVTYSNVVRHLVPAGRWEGQPATFRLGNLRGEDIDGCAAFLQADKPSAIIGAAVMAPKIN